MSTVYASAAKGVMQLPDGRTLTLNGFGAQANLSDGSSVYVSGVGNVALPDSTFTQITLVPAIGSATTATMVAGSYGQAKPVAPTGQMTLSINGAVYAHAVLVGGSASIAVPSGAFSGPGNYVMTASYSGDANFGPSSASEIFQFSS